MAANVMLSIVVPTYLCPAAFQRLCASVARFAPPGTELIAVVQSSETIPPAGVAVGAALVQVAW